MGAWCRCVLLTKDTPTWLMFQKPFRLGYLMRTVNETYMRFTMHNVYIKLFALKAVWNLDVMGKCQQ